LVEDLCGQIFGRVYALRDGHSIFRYDLRLVVMIDWVSFFMDGGFISMLLGDEKKL